MTDARDELAALIRDNHGSRPGVIADAILAAGWRAPKPIEYGRWYRTLTPDGKLWAETSDPRDWYLAHTDPAVALTWQRITTDDEWVEWVDHPNDMVHPSTLDEDDDD